MRVFVLRTAKHALVFFARPTANLRQLAWMVLDSPNQNRNVVKQGTEETSRYVVVFVCCTISDVLERKAKHNVKELPSHLSLGDKCWSGSPTSGPGAVKIKDLPEDPAAKCLSIGRCSCVYFSRVSESQR